jgi:hypothetical protein
MNSRRFIARSVRIPRRSLGDFLQEWQLRRCGIMRPGAEAGGKLLLIVR